MKLRQALGVRRVTIVCCRPQQLGTALTSDRGLRSRSAYTLIELLLVLVLMLVLAAWTWSGVEGMYERHQLREVAEMVRFRLLECRQRAVDSGSLYQFRLESGDRNFSISPFDEASSVDSAGFHFAGQLPETMRFAGVELQRLTVQAGSQPSTSLPAASATTAGWSEPILFYPDGQATSAALEVFDEQDRFVRLSVRGLTAAVSLGSLQRRMKP